MRSSLNHLQSFIPGGVICGIGDGVGSFPPGHPAARSGLYASVVWGTRAEAVQREVYPYEIGLFVPGIIVH